MTSFQELTGPGETFELVRGATGALEYRHAPASLRQVFLEGAGAAGDDPYLIYRDTRLTAAEHDRQVRRLAVHLHDRLGVRPGDRVAVAMRNRPEFFVAFWATQAVGAVTVPLNAWWSGPELAAALRHSGSEVLIADGDRRDRVSAEEVGLRAVLVAGESLDDVLAGPDVVLPDVEVGPDDPATIVYTSGTTGAAKGAVHSQRNFASALMHNRLFTEVGRREHSGPRVPEGSLLTYPLFHIAGLVNICLSMEPDARTTIALLHRWDPQVAADLIVDERLTRAFLVPTTLRSLLDEAGDRVAAAPALRVVAAGGASVPGELIDRLRTLFDGRVQPANGYGLTETTAGAISGGGEEYLRNPTSIGRPLPAMEVRLIDAGGVEVGVGGIGEIQVRGPSVCRGYWQDPDATARSFADGWFRTGDLGTVDEQGLYYVVGRIKEVIIRGGENVYCPEVEAALESHPDVLEAAVFGVPDDTYGETVGAVVRLRPGSTADAVAVSAFVAARLAYFKVPTQLTVIEQELPRTASGKLLKRELRSLVR